MYKLFKSLFKRPISAKNDSKHFVEVCLQYGPFREIREFEIEKRDPFLMIELFKQHFEDCDHIIRFRFFDRNTYFKNREFNCSGNYYFGRSVTLTQATTINSKNGISENVFQYDEYQIGGVIHFQSSLVLPLYGNDVVIGEELCLEEQKVKIKRLYRQHGI